MKKAFLTLAALGVALAALPAPLAPAAYNLLLVGGEEANAIHIGISPDGRSYVIDSLHPLEVGGSVCAHPEGDPTELLCEARQIAGFEVNAGGGDDKVSVNHRVIPPVTMRGGPGNDVLSGARGPDKLIGGAGEDVLLGNGGSDVLIGGPGDDVLAAGPGDDVIVIGQGRDAVKQGGGKDRIVKR